MTTETRHIPGIRTRAGLNTLSDDEVVDRALDSDDYTTRRLALVANMKRAQLDQARELLDVLEESGIDTPEALRAADRDWLAMFRWIESQGVDPHDVLDDARAAEE